MKIFFVYNQSDRPIVDQVAEKLKSDRHDILPDSLTAKKGSNVTKTVDENLDLADVIIVFLSKNFFNSKMSQLEFGILGLQQFSQKPQHFIVLRLDQIEIPSYIYNYKIIDLSKSANTGIEDLRVFLGQESETLSSSLENYSSSFMQDRDYQINNLRSSLRKGNLSLVCGAGVSVAAGIPIWNDLLVTLLKSMMKRISKHHLLQLSSSAAADFQQRYGSSSLILGKYLKNNLGKDFSHELRGALYASSPKGSIIMKSIANLARPQRNGRALDSIITFNFDDLIEEVLSEESISHKSIYSEDVNHDQNELPIYHVHGFLSRKGKINTESLLVFSEDAYHSQFIEPFSWSNLLQLNKLTQCTCLFVGISLTDPNMRRLLDVASRKKVSKTISHYIIKKLPTEINNNDVEKVAVILEEQDANILGLNVIWINDYDEIPDILKKIAE